MVISGDGTAQRDLGGARGFGETQVGRNDDGSLQADVSNVFENGLHFMGAHFNANALHLNTNGTVSFSSAYGEYPTDLNTLPDQPLIAPFWGDVDTRLDGEGAESGAIWLDVDPVADIVTITWDQVGVYRRNAEMTNTVQLQLFDRGGGDFDIVFRYEQIDWTQGTGEGDTGARAGLAGNGTVHWILPDEDPAALTQLPSLPGNTGIEGLWVYQIRNGQVSVPDGGSTGTDGADNLQGTSGNDLLD
ncbi:nidogen-like domain-containing protein, partial [Tateyamaria sp. ANG-S1]|uniref:nidogen-like domain-containing protein n=1 Tax=Tateyamaria sp. ANG-S1 TaxID=1577905 RepID=UPI00057FD13D